MYKTLSFIACASSFLCQSDGIKLSTSVVGVHCTAAAPICNVYLAWRGRETKYIPDFKVLVLMAYPKIYPGIIFVC